VSAAPTSAPSAPAPAPSDPAPDWIRDGWGKIIEELRLYARTVWGITVRPSRFAAAWASGEVRALNPLAVMATTLIVLGPIQHEISVRTKLFQGGNAMAADVYEVVAPYAITLLSGLLAHAVLLGLGSRRPVRVSLGVGAMISGGPLSIVNVVTSLVALMLVIKTGFTIDALYGFASKPDPQVLRAILRPAVILIVSAGAMNLLYLIWFARALAAAHAVRVWRAVAAVLVGAGVAGWLIGSLSSSYLLGPKYRQMIQHRGGHVTGRP
jgi:hypothetical protein